MKTRSLTTLAALLLGLLVAMLGATTTAATAADVPSDGAPHWRATVYPRSGADDEPLEIRTSGGCPRPATNILARVYGHGFPAEGTNVIGNTDAGVSAGHRFVAGLYTTMRQYMFDQPNPVPFEGTYTFVVTCRTAMYEKSHGDYVVAIRFTDPHSWVAAAPLSTKPGPHGHGSTGDRATGSGGAASGQGSGSGADSGSSAGNGSSAAGGSGSNGPGGSGSSTGSGTHGSGSHQDLAEASASTSSSSSDGGLTPLSWALIGAGALIAVGTVVLLRRRA